MCVHIDKRPQNIVFETPSRAVMKNSRHSAEAEPSVKRSDNTSTSIRISSSLISAPSSHFKDVSGEKDRSCGHVCVCVEYTRHWTDNGGGWLEDKPLGARWNAGSRAEQFVESIVCSCAALISTPMIIVNSLDFIKNESLSFLIKRSVKKPSNVTQTLFRIVNILAVPL